MYKFINWYTSHFPFPHRGWKFFRKLLIFLRLEDKIFKKKLYNGQFAYVSPVDHIQQNLFWYGYYEKPEIVTWTKFIKDGHSVADIGANVGLYALAASRQSPWGKIFAFEPVRSSREILLRNIGANALSNIQVSPLAASDRNSQTKIYHGENTNSSMASLEPPENFSGSWETVDTVRLDDFFGNENIDIVKIDVEGAELKVLSGMEQLIARCHPVIFIEVIERHLNKFQASRHQLYEFMDERKYKAFIVTGEGMLTRVKDKPESYVVVFIPQGYAVPPSITIKDN